MTAAESGTYTDFAQINLGGVKADGSDGVNEVTYLLLDVIEEMRLLQPSASIQVSKKNPDPLHQARRANHPHRLWPAVDLQHRRRSSRKWCGRARSLVDARNGGTSGCVEIGAFGKENYNLTGYFNLPKMLEITLHNGLDPRTGKQLGPADRRPGQLHEL